MSEVEGCGVVDAGYSAHDLIPGPSPKEKGEGLRCLDLLCVFMCFTLSPPLLQRRRVYLLTASGL